MKTEEHVFTNGEGHRLAARLDLPGAGPARAYALFAHCFTCGKDLAAILNISRALTDHGIGVLRFDFPGLGESEGAFAATTFTSNVDDLYRAAEYLEEIAAAPQIVIGHSLGGAAAIRVAPLLANARAVATIGAPADPVHVTHLLEAERGAIERDGEATVSIANRDFRIRREFIEDLESVSMEEATERLGRALLILHAPGDRIVGIDNAARIYERARHPKSFLSLDGADHLLSRAADSRYAGGVIAAWAERYLDAADHEEGDEVVARIGRRGLQTDLRLGGRSLTADEPVEVGGTDLGPTPYDLVAAGLGACTAMTLRLYADHKEWPLRSVEVRLRHDKIHAKDCDDCEEREGKIDLVRRELWLEGDLSDEQRERLAEIADRCPVHRTLESGAKVRTELRAEGAPEETAGKG